MNLTKRYVGAEFTGNAAVELVRAGHDLWRVTHMFKDGLTPNELALLEKKRAELIATQYLLSKIAHRLRQSGQCT